MEKISNIIPSNARTRSAMVDNSQPVRPGAPTFGRPVGKVTTDAVTAGIIDRVSLRSQSGEEPAEPPTYPSGAEGKRKQLENMLAQKFFDGIDDIKDHKTEKHFKSEELANEILENPDPVKQS